MNLPPISESARAREAAQVHLAAHDRAARQPGSVEAQDLAWAARALYEAALDLLLEAGRLREVIGLMQSVARSEVQLGMMRRRDTVELAAGATS